MESISTSQWSALASKRIFFGHQSVGTNILDGVIAILGKYPSIGVRVCPTPPSKRIESAGLYHAKIGVNGKPMTKLADFADFVGSNQVDLAMMKFCYLDLDGLEDPSRLFREYERTVNDVRKKCPALRIVHFTLPLTDNGNWKERLVKRIKGRPSARELNRLRNRYNSFVKNRYLGSDPVFDLAEIESTRVDGTREFELYKGQPQYVLASDMTIDGGHLNERGKGVAAEAFLSLLASL